MSGIAFLRDLQLGFLWSHRIVDPQVIHTQPGLVRAPEDAEAQLRLAVDYHTATFGTPSITIR